MGPFIFRIKHPPAHLSITHDRGLILSLFIANIKQVSCEYQFYSLWFDLTENRIRVDRFSSRRSIHSTTDRSNEEVKDEQGCKPFSSSNILKVKLKMELQANHTLTVGFCKFKRESDVFFIPNNGFS